MNVTNELTNLGVIAVNQTRSELYKYIWFTRYFHLFLWASTSPVHPFYLCLKYICSLYFLFV